MDKTKRVSPPPAPAAPLGRGRTRLQALRNSVTSAWRSTRQASNHQLDASSSDKATLIAELNRLRRTTHQHGRLLDALERLSHELGRRGSVERHVGAHQRKAMLNDQDRFLAELLDELEAKLERAIAERDQARELVEEQKAMLDNQDQFLAGLLDELEAKLTDAYAQRDQAQELVEQQKAMLSDHDHFLAGLLDEHEEEMAKAVAERDQLQQRVRQLQQELAAAQAATARAPAGASARGTRKPEANTEVCALRKELDQARQRVDQLASKYRTARDTLHRILDQRDEAQQAVVQLSRQLCELKQCSATPVPESRLPDSRGEAPARSRTPPYPSLAPPVRTAAPAAVPPRTDPGSPAPPAGALPRRHAHESARPARSPLATALANTDRTKK